MSNRELVKMIDRSLERSCAIRLESSKKSHIGVLIFMKTSATTQYFGDFECCSLKFEVQNII